MAGDFLLTAAVTFSCKAIVPRRKIKATAYSPPTVSVMLKQLSLCIFLSACLHSAQAMGHAPVEFMEVSEGKPSNLIEHDVQVKAVIDDKKRSVELAGPYFFSQAVGCMGRRVKDPKAYLSWYKLVDAKKEDERKVVVTDLFRGTDKTPLTIGSAEFLLSPSQRITAGPPARVPHGLDHYIAYRVLGAPSVKLDVELTASAVPTKRRVGKPIFLCVPTEEWHHEEYFAASHPKESFVVYELDSKDHVGDISLIDQFGLNQLRSDKSRWLCASAMLLKKRDD